jgi:hypothetical protein
MNDYEPAWTSWENLFREAEPGERFVIPQSELERVAGKKAVTLAVSGEDRDPLIGAIERLTGRHPRFESRASDGKRSTWTIIAGQPCACSIPQPRARRPRKNPERSSAPADVRTALRRGLALHAAGFGGKGLRPATVKWARLLAEGEPITRTKAVQMAAWFARHDAAKAEVAARRADPTSPAAVAFLLWGGAPGRRWARELNAQQNPRKSFWRSLTQPMKGEAAAKQYERLHWGIKPKRRVVGFEVPGMTTRQEVVQLGKLRALVLESANGQLSVVVKPRAPHPRLVVGARDNRLYIADHHGFALPPIYDGATILRVDYDATKGRESAYFYHDHEPEFPRLRLLAGGLPQYSGGGYHIAPEGIVG